MASKWMNRYHWRNSRLCGIKAVETMKKYNLGTENILWAEANLQLAYIFLAHGAWGKARDPLENARKVADKLNIHILMSKIFIAMSDLYHQKKRGKFAGRDHEEAKKFRFMADEEERQAEMAWAEAQRKETEKLIAAGLMPNIPTYQPPQPTHSLAVGQNLAYQANPNVPAPGFFNQKTPQNHGMPTQSMESMGMGMAVDNEEFEDEGRTHIVGGSLGMGLHGGDRYKGRGR
eukprot:CAMPEP_0197535920 /NCGR_PEP_ID=MMETSP1318-20131121/52223_1 /TAXON_ID=552666 /ORGANISM="Partenskyella glossopodia, Strain RCC365" /LENGTH=231 /DNA_ID=CAMNT_0043093647 /DNA_START=251 /DNA_END=946 /DNA_ORIENTATION=+